MLHEALSAIARPLPRHRRADLWAGVYCRTFDVDGEDSTGDAHDGTGDGHGGTDDGVVDPNREPTPP